MKASYEKSQKCDIAAQNGYANKKSNLVLIGLNRDLLHSYSTSITAICSFQILVATIEYL